MKTLAFFSYKGGSGRTSLIYNTIPFLVKKLGADEKHPIILVDMDLDSAGLSYILDVDTKTRMTTNKLISSDNASMLSRLKADVKMNPKSLDELDFYNLLAPVGFQFGLSYKEANANKSVLFVPAQPKTTGAGFDMPNNKCIYDFISICEGTGCKAVIFDLPAGNQVTGRQALQRCDTVLVCFRITKQHRRGTIEFLEDNLDTDGQQKYILVPNAVPDCRKKVKVAGGLFNFESVKEDTISKLQKAFADKGLDSKSQLITSMFEGEWYGVPEVGRFKLEEDILYRIKENLHDGEQLLEDEELAYKAYDKVTDLIVGTSNE